MFLATDRPRREEMYSVPPVGPIFSQRRHYFKSRQAARFFERPLRPARLRYLLRCVVRQCGVMQGAATQFAADSQILGCGTIQKTLQTGFNTEYGVCRQSALNLTDTRAEFSPESDTIPGSEKRHRLQSKVVLSSWNAAQILVPLFGTESGAVVRTAYYFLINEAASPGAVFRTQNWCRFSCRRPSFSLSGDTAVPTDPCSLFGPDCPFFLMPGRRALRT